MFQPLTAAIGLRYLRAKRRNGFISFISMASVLGIFIGVVALITTISVMTGFQEELRHRILGTVAHATVEGVNGSLSDWPQAVALAKKDARVLAAAPYIQTETLLQAQNRQGALMRGIVPELESGVSELAHSMRQGSLSSLKAGQFNIILGSELAATLNVRVGDYVNAFVSESSATPFGSMPRAKRFKVSGIFSVGAQEYDFGLALIHLEDAQKLLRMNQDVTGVRLKLHDLWKSWEVARDLAGRMDGIYMVRD
nr:ABC transporter permease [Arenimonas sp.]